MMQRGAPTTQQQHAMQGAMMTNPNGFNQQQQQQQQQQQGLAGTLTMPGQALSLQQQQAAQFQAQQQLMQQQVALQGRGQMFQQQQQQQGLQQTMQQGMQQMQQVNMGQQQVNMGQPQMGIGQPQQQHIPHQGLNGGWQSDKDTQDRRKMIAKIVQLLQQRKPNAPQEWLKKLPQMAKRLEESLYRSAPSFEAYNDFNTLKQRLQQLAMNIGMNKTKKMQSGGVGGSTQMGMPQQQNQQHFQQQPLMQQQQRQAAAPQQLNGMNPMGMQPLQQQGMSLQQPQMPAVQLQQQQQQQPQRQMVNMHDINPIMGQNQAVLKPQQLVNTQDNNQLAQMNPNFGRQGALAGNTGILNNALNNQKLNGMQAQQNQQQQMSTVLNDNTRGMNNMQPTSMNNSLNNTLDTSLNSSAANNTTTTNASNGAGMKPGSDRQQVLRHQQQRLLLLRHAAKCPHEDGRCPVTPHCAGMKRLWKHIAECKDQKCVVPHCVSSRYVLSHYHRCKDVRCPVCGPVREAIHRSHEKAKHQQMQQLQNREGNNSNNTTQQQNQLGTALNSQQQPQHLAQQAQQMKTPQQLQQPFLQQQQLQGKPMSAAPTGVPLQPPMGGAVSPTLEMNSQKRRKTNAVNAMKPTPNSLMNTTNMAAGAMRQQAQPLQTPLVEPVMQHLQQPQQPKPFMQSQPQPQQSLPQANQVLSTQAIPAPALSANKQITHQNKQNFQNQPHQTIQQQQQQQPQQQTPTVPLSSTSMPPAQPTREKQQPKAKPSSSATPSSVPSKAAAVATPQEDHTLINCFSNEQIETHIASLNKGLQLPPAKLKVKCLEVLKMLQTHQHGWVFNAPVDPVELGLPDYFHVIKRPMDLGTIKKRLENGCYHSLEDFESDTHLTFDNAMLYNQEGSVVHNMAREMKDKFIKDFSQLLNQLNAEEDEKRKNGDACFLCGCEKLLFEPPVFYCNGMNCPSKRIRRNTYYYVGGNNQYHWCHQCYGELKENQQIDIGEISMKKAELVKKKNDEVHEESWVQCDKCERWIHQICALFNTRQNKDQRSEYTCPRCTIDNRKKVGKTRGSSKTPMAKDLPRTKLSEWLEDRVRGKCDDFLQKYAEDKAEMDGTSVEDSLKSINSGPITIRQVTSMDRKLEVRERMKRRYAFRNYPSEFTYRCKCIVVFQNLDGVDVVLFGLYVYEHDENNPPPNQRAVYISYLDSVHYMRPRKMRTFVYHEILIAYLDYVRRKGFSTAHIWACPPLKGDDYILYAKPEDQKTPKDDRLRQWYLDMLVECQRRGIVGKLTNMYDLYFSDEKQDASVVPYMEGDYFPAEAENIIKDIEEGKNSKKSGTAGKKSKKKEREKNKSTGRGGTRSSGIDEEALAASGLIPPGVETKSLEEGGRDYVMAKLGETIHPMRESFIVAYLCWSGAKESDLIVPKEIEEYRQEHNISCKAPTLDEKSGTDTKVDGAKSSELKDSNGAASSDSAKSNNDSSKKRDANGNIKPDPAPSSSAATKKKDGTKRAGKVTDDDEEELDCEFLNNRQAFLNLCQGNHYQFDQLRRAKHTSMMVLWHLHNRDAPKFVQQCAVCSREILTGYRYHCPICADYDQCQECVSNPATPRHPHELKPIPINQQNELTQAQRKERQRNVQLHMQLLLHAATCVSPKCPSANCTKMKGLLKHGVTCQVKASGGCNVCRRIWALLQIHARQCKQSQCPVPNCMAIRERFRQLTQQQQAMDDRRRQEMNRAYRAAGR